MNREEDNYVIIEDKYNYSKVKTLVFENKASFFYFFASSFNESEINIIQIDENNF